VLSSVADIMMPSRTKRIVIRTQVLMVLTTENVTLHTVIAVVSLILSYSSLRGEVAMDEVGQSKTEAMVVDTLIETDTRILEQVRKDLSEEYMLFMSLVLKERLSPQSGGGTSLFDHLRKAGSASATSGESSKP
jgi:hypothetical protein